MVDRHVIQVCADLLEHGRRDLADSVWLALDKMVDLERRLYGDFEGRPALTVAEDKEREVAIRLLSTPGSY